MSGETYGAGSSQSRLSGSGQTTAVRLRPTALSPTDKNVLCKAICVCSRQPDEGKDGADLKQQCVSRNLRDLDKSMQWQSPYKAEVNYDMSKEPPASL
ncbi:hypothetical protein DID96_32550 [Burkholderia sp. Bp8963]|nr:hypothetical protein DID96_32550 [Burkholderia sp. Bp8963]